jgi:hypothetical protein
VHVRVVIAAIRAVLSVLLIVMSFSRTSPIAAGGEVITDRLAHILLNFTHVPSVSQEETLRDILDDAAATVQERVVAEALLNMEHVVSLEDRPKLDMLLRDDSAPASVKILASILRHVTHTPTEEDKEKLRALLQHASSK